MAYCVLCMLIVTFNRHVSPNTLNLRNCSNDSATLHLNEKKQSPYLNIINNY